MLISYQGEPGAYSEAAVYEHFGADAAADPCKSFEDVFQRVVEKDSQYGFIPIENSLAGSIHRNYDLLLRHELRDGFENGLHFHGLRGGGLGRLREGDNRGKRGDRWPTFIKAGRLRPCIG